MDKVSVIVPVYGVEKYIEECARSLFAQTYPACEFIFVDDGSPDRSVEILESLIDDNVREKVKIVRKPNGGLPSARRAGLEAATGEWVLHLDSDDRLEPDAVEALVSEALAKEADIVYPDIINEYPSGSSISHEFECKDPREYIAAVFRWKAHGYLASTLSRKSLYSGVFFPLKAMHEDKIMMAQLVFKARVIVHLPKALYHYRRSVGVTSSGKLSRDMTSARNMLDFYSYYSGSGPVEPVREDILLRAAWTARRHAPELFGEYPFLKGAASAIPLRKNCALKLYRQIILKIIL